MQQALAEPAGACRDQRYSSLGFGYDKYYQESLVWWTLSDLSLKLGKLATREDNTSDIKSV